MPVVGHLTPSSSMWETQWIEGSQGREAELAWLQRKSAVPSVAKEHLALHQSHPLVSSKFCCIPTLLCTGSFVKINHGTQQAYKQ